MSMLTSGGMHLTLVHTTSSFTPPVSSLCSPLSSPCSLLEPLLGSQAHEQAEDSKQLLGTCAPLLRRAAQERLFDLVRKVQHRLAALGKKIEPATYTDCMVAAARVSACLPGDEPPWEPCLVMNPLGNLAW